MRKKCFIGSATAFYIWGMVGMASANPTNLINNGSFENPTATTNAFSIFPTIPGWTLISGEPYEIWNGTMKGTTAPDGSQHLETNNSVFEQAVATTPGQRYDFSFSYSHRPTYDINRIQVAWNGDVIADIQVNDSDYLDWNWSTASFSIEASTTSSSIRFIALNDPAGGGMHIDNVQLSIAPHLDDGLVAHYPFNGNANDESGNGNHGTVHGAVLTQDRFGNASSAYEVTENMGTNGSGNYIRIPDVIGGLDNFTISLWVNEDSISNPHGEAYIQFGDSTNEGSALISHWVVNGTLNFHAEHGVVSATTVYANFQEEWQAEVPSERIIYYQAA
jgi:hypothetical protein